MNTPDKYPHTYAFLEGMMYFPLGGIFGFLHTLLYTEFEIDSKLRTLFIGKYSLHLINKPLFDGSGFPTVAFEHQYFRLHSTPVE